MVPESASNGPNKVAKLVGSKWVMPLKSVNGSSCARLAAKETPTEDPPRAPWSWSWGWSRLSTTRYHRVAPLSVGEDHFQVPSPVKSSKTELDSHTSALL